MIKGGERKVDQLETTVAGEWHVVSNWEFVAQSGEHIKTSVMKL